MKYCKNTNSQKGFTLVELAIVLVIIGLLIGGLLVAQSLIGSTKVQSVVRQLAQFDASVGTFYSKFNQIPGDATSTGATAGDNDGWIEDGTISAATTCAAGTLFAGEVGKFWYDMSINGLKTTGSAAQYTDRSNSALANTAAGSLVNTYIPMAPIEKNLGYLVCSSAINTSWYVLGAISTGAAGVNVVTSGSGLRGADASAIDTKLDDGYSDGGYIQGTTGVATIAITPGTGTTAYTFAAGNAQNSTLFVRLGIQTGNLQ